MGPSSAVISEIPGVRVGHWSDQRAPRGRTVVLLPAGTTASGEVRGAAPGTREWALLEPGRTVVALAYVAGPVLLVVASSGSGPWRPLARAAIGAVLLGGFYLALGLAFPADMGLGDVKWAGLIGLYLGYLGWATLTRTTLVAFGAASVVVLVGYATGRSRWLVLPMVPFITAGALVAVLTTR